ncbi:MAG: PAS domain S-box protein [Deltaproteobacteria bacterium]|nr:PAS domain S-box protein [Deltaproteobacteria bacterium]
MEWMTYNFSFDEYALALSSWIITGAGYVFFTAVLVLGLGRLHYSMDSTIEKLKIQTSELQHAKEHLEEELRSRRQTETALRESEERFRTVLENLPGSVSVHDLEGNHLMVNDEACAVTGYTREELYNMTVMDAAGPEFHYDAARELWDGMELGTSFALDILTRRKDGSVYDSEVHLTKIMLGGEPVMLSLIFDVTERKKSEEALKKSEMYLRTLMSTIPDLIWLKDEHGKYLYCNSRFEDFFGANEEKIIGKTDYDFIDKKLADFFARHDRTVIEKGRPSRNEEEITFASDGHREILETIKTPMYQSDGTLFGVLGVGRDITERKKIEESLARRSELERLIGEISSGFIGMSHHEINSYIDEALASIGKKSGVDRINLFLFHPDGEVVDNTNEWCADHTVPQIDNLKAIRLETESPWFAKQIRSQDIVHITGVEELPSEAHMEKELFRNHNIKSLIVLAMREGENLVGFLGFGVSNEKRIWLDEEIVILRIIGETFTSAIQRRKVEEEQEKLQAQLTTAVDLAHLGPWEVDIERGEFLLNDHFYRIYHTTVEEMGGYKMTSEEYGRRFVHPNDLHFIEENFKKAMEPDAPAFKRDEHRMFYADGTMGYVMVQMLLQRNSKGIPIKAYGVNQDITEWKLAQERLRESEEKLARARKMESLGLLAGGVAHDLNNVLSGIVSYPELLLLDLPEDSKMRKSIETIQQSGEKAVAIVQDLLSIARGAVMTKEPLNMNDIIDEYLSSPEFMKLQEYHPTVSINTDLFPSLFNIEGSPIHIKKVIMNLVANASEAIESKGNINISTRNIYLDKPISRYEEVKTGEYVVMSVSDEGSGIALNNLERIFEPFFTKKVMGVSGTGLGLTVVWNIVQDHLGYIDVVSDRSGTQFDLYFPITRNEILDKIASVMLEEIKGRGEKILVIDDIESQREISCEMLDILGYQYASVSSGEEAIAYLKKNRVDLILLDMIMDPGINGRETYEQIMKIYPKQKAVIVSGFSETEDVVAIQKLGAGQYIKKPFTLAELGSAINKELINHHS